MKRPAVILFAAILLFPGCTDQPEPAQPTTPSTSSTPDTAETAVTDDTISATIAEILEHPAPSELPTGSEAMDSFTNLLLPDEDEDNGGCLPVTETRPVAAGFGQVISDTDLDDDEDETESLAAFGFDTNDQAENFTADLEDFAATCSVLRSEHEPLTHHTDESFEIQIERADDTETSLVVLRDEDMVLVASSTPPSDVALSLTLADQLQEMLR